jgi:hypothetical protein
MKLERPLAVQRDTTIADSIGFDVREERTTTARRGDRLWVEVALRLEPDEIDSAGRSLPVVTVLASCDGAPSVDCGREEMHGYVTGSETWSGLVTLYCELKEGKQRLDVLVGGQVLGSVALLVE